MFYLFLSFLKIGLFTFGGGYAMIPLVSEVAVNNFGISETTVLDFIAISESTPGPISINMATFVGYTYGGILGAFLATLGVVLPSFIIILFIVSLVKGLINYGGVKAFFDGVRPVVVALILGTGITILLQVLFSIQKIGDKFIFDYKALIILIILLFLSLIYKLKSKKSFSPILLILVSALLGIVFYGFL